MINQVVAGAVGRGSGEIDAINFTYGFDLIQSACKSNEAGVKIYSRQINELRSSVPSMHVPLMYAANSDGVSLAGSHVTKIG